MNNTSSSIPSGTITATDIMVCTKADYNISQTYQPYKTPYDGTATQTEIEDTFYNN